MFISQFYLNNENCVYNNAGDTVKFYSVNSYSNISREITTLYLENSCNFNILMIGKISQKRLKNWKRYLLTHIAQIVCK